MNSAFERLLELRDDARLPPVDQWHPERNGSIDIVIRRDGSWVHEGGLIKRPELVRLFSSILRKDEDGYVLVTPAERLLIQVEDVPFVAVDLEYKPSPREAGTGTNNRQEDTAGQSADQSGLLFTTNVQDVVLAGPAHPLRVDPATNKPYVEVRAGLEACISRPVYYRLVDYCEVQGNRLIVRSDGATFDLGPSA